MANRNSTPDTTSASSLRPPTNRGHHLRASADMSGLSSPMSARIRPASEVYLNAPAGSQNPETDAYDKAAQKWLADLESYENTLDEMAAATLDQDFKDELSAIEQWFRVLSEAERTAALYALLQQTTPVQIRFFIAILQQMGRSHPASDPMNSRMSELISGEPTRHSFPSRPPPSPTVPTGAGNRNSTLDPATVSAMFPDAAAALATQRARYSQISGSTPTGTKSNRNSAIFENKPSSTLTPQPTNKESHGPSSPWRREENTGTPSAGQPGSGGSGGSGAAATNQPPENRPKSGHETMGQWQAPPPSAGLKSPRHPPTSSPPTTQTVQTATAAGNGSLELPELSPFGPSSGNWASMVNTPVAPMFGQDAVSAQANADMVANATAMKLAAMSTVNNRFLIDSDVRKFRRSRGDNPLSPGMPPGLPQQSPRGPMGAMGQNVIMYDEHGRPIQIPAAAIQAAQQQAAAAAAAGSPGLSPGMGRRSRPTSPGYALGSATGSWNLSELASPQQNNGFLTPYQASPLLNPSINLNSLMQGAEGYGSDHSDLTGARGRSPRGSRRGNSKPPEDPTDPTLLNDIAQWLRSLRLHKYTDNLKDLKWPELIELDDEALEKRGVAAVGARRKMLKVFEQVKEAKKDGKLPA